jgi:hypothetical protein
MLVLDEKQSSKHGVASGVGQMKEDWTECWGKLPQYQTSRKFLQAKIRPEALFNTIPS